MSLTKIGFVPSENLCSARSIFMMLTRYEDIALLTTFKVMSAEPGVFLGSEIFTRPFLSTAIPIEKSNRYIISVR